MSSNKFMGFSIAAITQWHEVLRTGSLNPEKHCDALDEGLIAVVNGETYLAPDGSGAVGNPKSWAMNLRAAVAGATKVSPIPEQTLVAKEFGTTLTTDEFVDGLIDAAAAYANAGSPREPELEEESPIPVSDVAPTPSPEVAIVKDVVITEPSKNDQLRSKVAALPSYYAPLKEPFSKLIDLGADEVVIDTALELAGKPYNLGEIAAYARHITNGAKEDRDLMVLIQAAHRAASKVEDTSEANAAIMVKILERTPENRRSVLKERLEAQITDGQDKYWAESWGQVEAAIAAKRSNAPINLFFHIVSDMQRNSDLADQRGVPKINSYAEAKWIENYLPKPAVTYTDGGLSRGGRKFFMPKLKDAIERQGCIPLPWVISIVVDNDYPTRALVGLCDKIVGAYPALGRIVTEDQFEYAMSVVAKIMIDRAARWRESWDGNEGHLGSSMTHHAVYAAYQYLDTFAYYCDSGMEFMNPLKDSLDAVLSDNATMANLAGWYLNVNPWKHGKTPEESLDHLGEEEAYEARATAFREQERGSTGTGEADA